MPKILVTGHRPDKLGKGYYLKSPTGLWLREQITEFLVNRKCTEAICGGAQGTDTIFALAAIDLNIPLRIYVPFQSQPSRWLPSAKAVYEHILGLAAKVITVHRGPMPTEKYEVYKLYDKRNKAMVDYVHNDNPQKNKILTVYDGSPGGTHNCLSYASKKQPYMETAFINPREFQPEPEII